MRRGLVLFSTFREDLEKPAGVASAFPPLQNKKEFSGPVLLNAKITNHFRATRVKVARTPESSMLFVAAPCPMSFFTLCLPWGVWCSR